MEKTSAFLEGYSDLEKGAYLGAIASLATADRKASNQEIAQLEALSDAASLSEDQKAFVVRAATELTGDDLKQCLSILKKSELRFALVADLLAFAKADGETTAEEEARIKEMAAELGVEEKQFSLLDQFQQKATSPEEEEAPAEDNASFLSSGLGQKMQAAGINTSGLLKGLLAVAGPILLSSLLSGRRRGGFGGGFGSPFGGGFGGMGGGLGSIIGMLNGGRGMGSTGGLLGRILGGRF